MKPSKNSNTFCARHVTEWIDSFPVAVYLTDTMDHLYSEEAPSTSAQTKRKEKGENRRKPVSGDRQRISAKLENIPIHYHNSHELYNIVNGQVARNEFNDSEAVLIGEKMANSFRNSLSSGFHAVIPVK